MKKLTIVTILCGFSVTLVDNLEEDDPFYNILKRKILFSLEINVFLHQIFVMLRFRNGKKTK